MMNRWQNPGDQTDIPRFVYNESATSTNSSRYIHSTDHLRLKNFTLGFTLPNQWTQKLMIDKVRIYFSGNNLLTWAKWKQYDPETPVNGEVFVRLLLCVLSVSEHNYHSNTHVILTK